MNFEHVSVLLNECIDGLNIKSDGIYVDGTMGGAGHSSEIIKRLSEKGLLIGIDQDTNALKASGERLKDYNNVEYVHSNFCNIKKVLEDLN
ncbi:MAG: 16S rRNA (cytosine(1402)-N(4))-methyltransferase, partial [Clostridium sp.]